MRPFELLLLAGAMWWGLNASSKEEQIARLNGTYEEPEADSKWNVLMTMVKVLGVTTGYLLITVTMLSILEPEGLGWTLAIAAAGMGAGTAALLLVRRAGQQALTTVFLNNNENVAADP